MYLLWNRESKREQSVDLRWPSVDRDVQQQWNRKHLVGVEPNQTTRWHDDSAAARWRHLPTCAGTSSLILSIQVCQLFIVLSISLIKHYHDGPTLLSSRLCCVCYVQLITLADRSSGSIAFIRVYVCVCMSICLHDRTKRLKLPSPNLPRDSLSGVLATHLI